jgi:hypothetical protein
MNYAHNVLFPYQSGSTRNNVFYAKLQLQSKSWLRILSQLLSKHRKFLDYDMSIHISDNMDGKRGSQTSLSQTSGQKRKREDDVSKYGAEIQWRKYPRLLLQL